MLCWCNKFIQLNVIFCPLVLLLLNGKVYSVLFSFFCFWALSLNCIMQFPQVNFHLLLSNPDTNISVNPGKKYDQSFLLLSWNLVLSIALLYATRWIPTQFPGKYSGHFLIPWWIQHLLSFYFNMLQIIPILYYLKILCYFRNTWNAYICDYTFIF